MAFEVAKSGWVQRLSTFLRRWKKNWLVLYQDGMLKYFDSPDSHVAEEVYNLPRNCMAVYAGEQVVGDPPTGLGRSCLFSVQLRDETLTFCAEGPDDMSAWQLAIDEARAVRAVRGPSAPQFPVNPPPYPGHACQGPHHPTYVVPHDAVNTVVYQDGNYYRDDPYYRDDLYYRDGPYYQDGPYYRRRRRGYDGGDVAMGMMGGMALGSLMWGPMLWW